MFLKKFKSIVLIILMSWVSAGLYAGGDIMVSLRFYEGLRGKEPAKSQVVTSYHLKPMFVGNMVSARDLNEERDELLRVFNLAGLKLMTRTRFAWHAKEKDKRFQVIILNGHEFLVELAQTAKPDGFEVDVVEKGKKDKSLLHTDISLPQQKTAVFGFEDSMGNPYFLSFFREKNDNVIRDEPVALPVGVQPKLLKKVAPVYPEEAKKYKVEGKVILGAVIDTDGRVVRLKILHGHPLLRNAAIQAVRTWRYEPLIIDGEKRAAEFTVTWQFSLPGPGGGEKTAIPFIWPSKGYLTSQFGRRIHPVTGKPSFHNGIDIAAKEGKGVAASADGIVLSAEFHEYYGNLVIIDHQNGYTTRYGQLKSFTVKKGDKVKQGGRIGYVGSTGRGAAPHLHWEVRKAGKPINPLTLIED
jgi:TonB family protein